MSELVAQPCLCGCGQMATVDHRRKRVSKWLPGHNPGRKGVPTTPEAKAKLAAYTGERSSNYSHGWSKTITYTSWNSMRSRCRDQSNASWKLYGGRGIQVCERWDSSFEAFLQDMGERPSKEHSIDRIDPDGNYEPSNCRWLTRAEQNARRKDPGGWVTRRANQARESH